MKARIKFSKAGTMRFIGHLDLMRYFQKAFRRADIPITYSEGFSPHPVMSFASPLGLGITSEGEYLDIQVNQEKTPEDMVAQMNTQMNEEIQVLSYTPLTDSAKTGMAVFDSASYLVCHRDGYPEIPAFVENMQRFLAQDAIIVTKKTKRSEKEMDIRPYIFKAEYDFTEYDQGIVMGTPMVMLHLQAGSVTNIKPELVMEAFCRFAGQEYNSYAWQIHRLDMFGPGEVPLSEYDRRA